MYLVYDHMHLTNQYMKIKDKSTILRQKHFSCSFYALSEEEITNYTGVENTDSHKKDAPAKSVDEAKPPSRSQKSSHLVTCPRNPTNLGKYVIMTS